MRRSSTGRLIAAFLSLTVALSPFGLVFAADPFLCGAIEEQFLDIFEIQNDVILSRHGSKLSPYFSSALRNAPLQGLLKLKSDKSSVLPAEIKLDASLRDVKQPLELEKGKSLIITGKNIARFLATEPDILLVEQQSPDKLLVTGGAFGYTYFHIWDDTDRWTLEFMCVSTTIQGQKYADEFQRKQDSTRNFKLSYDMSWNSEESGRSLYKKDINRTSDSFYHRFKILGSTPYGELDTGGTFRRLNGKSSFTSRYFKLKNGKIGPLRNFGLSGGNISTGFSNLGITDSGILGVNFTTPAFKNKIRYDLFWGRDMGGGQGSASTVDAKTPNQYLAGGRMSYLPTKNQTYRFSLARGWGISRNNDLNEYGYDLLGDWLIGKNGGLNYEVAYDSESFANLLNARYAGQKLTLTGQLRDISQKFMSITGGGWSQGQVGSLFNMNYNPNDKLSINSRLDVYKERLYPALDHDDRLNEDFDIGADFRPDSATGISGDYQLKNDLGKSSQTRYQNSRLNLTRKFKFIKEIQTNFGYSYQLNESYSSSTSNYDNNKVLMGVSVPLIGEVYYYIRKEINWLYAKYYREHSMPNVFETGLDWSQQLGNSPFYWTVSFNYHDEERTQSSLSFLSGQDYVQGYTELRFRPSNDTEIYGNCRIRNTWAESENTRKIMEASFSGGLRYMWDTGLRWDAICDVEGYVFKDNNFDGLRQRDDAPIEGVKVYYGDKVQSTDLFGYFKFKGVRGRNASIGLDTDTIPGGYLGTGPLTQNVAILHHQTITLYFGLMSRSEIRGVVFVDNNGDGKPSQGEEGIGEVIFSLETGKKVKSESADGRYVFSSVAPGKHTLTVVLDSIPIEYIPDVPLVKEIELSEGVTYLFNLPVRKAE